MISFSIDSDGFYEWIFDLYVYNNNQQVRLYKATKFGKHNLLLPTSDFPFNQQNEQHISINNTLDYSMLNHALISYTLDNTNHLIISHNKSKWSLINQQKNSIIDFISKNNFIYLTIENTSEFETSIAQPTTTTRNIDEVSNKQEHYKSIVSKLIKEPYHTNGYVQSCQKGTKIPIEYSRHQIPQDPAGKHWKFLENGSSIPVENYPD